MTMTPHVSESGNGSAASLGISSELLEMLVCPVDRGELSVRDGSLACTVCQRTYSVEDGIPDMVVEAEGQSER